MGFFSETDLSSRTPAGCGTSCSRYRNCAAPKVPLSGEGREGILVVTDVPLDAGELGYLRQTLSSVGIGPDAYWVIPAVACHHEKEPPTPASVQACRPNVLQAITKCGPRLILMLGKTAMDCVVGHSNAKMAFGKRKGFPLLCGKVFPDRSFPGTWLACAWSPTWVLGNSKDPVVDVIWRSELAQILATAATPPVDVSDKVTILTGVDEVLPVLNRVLGGTRPLGFDYETTGLKPDALGHRIVSIGFAPTPACGFAFALGTTPEWDAVKDVWRSILGSRDRAKIAHNLPYEWAWSHKCFKVVPIGWAGDTQVLAHLEDSRSGHSGLKVQAYLKFGVPSYDDSVARYIHASRAVEDRDGCNAINNMAQAPVKQMLTYNALDALYTLRLWYWYKERGMAANASDDFTIHG